jgi:hypothetical protein
MVEIIKPDKRAEYARAKIELLERYRHIRQRQVTVDERIDNRRKSE